MIDRLRALDRRILSVSRRLAWRAPLVARVSQQELADLVGSVREVVARALRELREDHVVVVARWGITVLDPSRLAERAWSS